MKDRQPGVDLSSSIRVGTLLSSVMWELRELRRPIDMSLMIHNLYERSTLKDSDILKNAVDKNIADLRSTLRPKIIAINDLIRSLNRITKALDFEHEIPHLNSNEILAVVKKRLNTIYEIENVQKLSNEHFDMSLWAITQKPIEAIKSFYSIVDNERYVEDVEKLPLPYKYTIRQALAVCSVGYYSTSVFIAGRTVEELINDICSTTIKLKQMKDFDILSTKFIDKIGKLKSINAIGEDSYHRLQSIRIDRNEFGHPGGKVLSKKQAHLRIQTICEVIPDLHKILVKNTAGIGKP